MAFFSQIFFFHALQLLGKFLQRVGHRCVQDNVGSSHGSGASQHTELKLISGEGKG